MIAQLRGTLVEKGLDYAVVDTGGVGYHVAISLNTVQALPQAGQQVLLLTYLQVREDALALYGFATSEERHAFSLCTSVSGVGPKLALATLSGLEPSQLAEAIHRGDVARLQRVPGIGKKTAERLVLELRDKFPRPGAPSSRSDAKLGGKAAPRAGSFNDVVTALCNLGYRPADAERATEQALEQEPAAPIEAVLRRALRLLQRD